MKLKSRSARSSISIMSAVAHEELEAAWRLNVNLLQLSIYASNFECAVRLADQAEQMIAFAKQDLESNPINAKQTDQEIMDRFDPVRIYSTWMAIAAREAAMTLDHFEHLRRTIQADAHRIRSIARLLDRAKLKEAGKLLREHFPDAEHMRDAVAHDAERGSTPQAVENNAFNGSLTTKSGNVFEGGKMTLSHVDGRTLHMTWKQKLISITVDEAALDHLLEISATIVSAFDPVVTASGWPTREPSASATGAPTEALSDSPSVAI